jgi:hypothetical protein
MSANLFKTFFVNSPQNRHPERSASQIYRPVQRIQRGVRRACPERSRGNTNRAYLTHAARAFSTTKAREQDLLRYALDGHGYISSSKMLAGPPGAGFGG